MEIEKDNEDEISLKEIVLNIKSHINYLITQWFKIIAIGAIAGCLGFCWAYFTPVTYSAKLSFVVEESKSSSGSLASLAGQFGFDIGSSGGNGLLSGENLLLFLKSVSLTKETLLTPYDSSKNYSLADEYANLYKLRSKWASSSKIGKEIFFPPGTLKQPYTRLQDSLLQTIITTILKGKLIVERPEKKAAFITVETSMKGELLSKYYCERLVQKAIDRYVQSKTRRQKSNVDRLQAKADSINRALNNKTYNNASDLERTLDINPGEKTATVTAEVSSREKMMLVNIYGEVVKNLEIAKVQLTQETPTIQVVDEVMLPLKIIKKSKLITTIIFGVIGVFSMIAFLIIKKLFEKAI